MSGIERGNCKGYLTLITAILYVISTAGCSGGSGSPSQLVASQSQVSTPATTPDTRNPTETKAVDVGAFGSLSAAVAAIGSAKTTLAFSAGQSLTSDLVIPQNIELLPLNGATITVSSGTLTYNGATDRWPLAQVFAGAGAVAGVKEVHPEWFGAIGDGSTNDLVPFRAAFNVACTGATFILRPGADYYLGVAAPDLRVLPYDGAKLKVVGNNATISTATSVTGQAYVIALTNPVYAEFDAVNFANPGYDPAISWKGVHHIYLVAKGATDSGNIVLNNVTASSGLSPLTVFGPFAAGRIRGIKFTGNCVFTNTYYGSSFQGQGDQVTGGYTAVNSRRAYFPYGVSNHDLEIKIIHDGASYGSTGAIEIASYASEGYISSGTRSIHIKVVFSGTLKNFSSCVLLKLESDTGAAVLDDIDINLNLAAAAWTDSTDVIDLSAYNLADAAQTTTASKWDHIKLSGDFIRGAGVLQTVFVNATQTTKGHMAMDLSSAPPATGPRHPDFAGFNTVYSETAD